jgi:2-polyprenyl-3-methyl-5-hydroxy-6-metoxy-1,4-benzoquinol methylase
MIKHPDFGLLLKEPIPFEMDLPWGKKGFSERFYRIVHYWGIPTEKEVAFLDGCLKSKPSRILDLACGGGRHSIELASMGHHVTGIDVGKHPIELARKEADKKGLKIEFIHDDMLKLDYRMKFDMALFICNQISHLSPKECQIVFKNISRSLVGGGIFVVHLTSFTDKDKSSFVHWYLEKEPFYLKNQSIVHREQYYFKEDRTKLIRDFAVDTVTRENKVFGVSEKNYVRSELETFGKSCGLVLTNSFGDYDKSPLNENSPQRIFVFVKER